MTLVIDICHKMFQFIFGCIISEKPISIGRNPNNPPGIMDDMVTFIVDITYFILWNQLEILAFSGFGKHVRKPSRMIVYPVVSMIITNQFSLFNIQTRICGHLSGSKLISIYSGSSQDHPLIFQQEISGWRCRPCHSGKRSQLLHLLSSLLIIIDISICCKEIHIVLIGQRRSEVD